MKALKKMDSLKKMDELIEELSKPIEAVKGKEDRVNNYIKKLQDEKQSILESGDIDNIERIIEIDSQIQAAKQTSSYFNVKDLREQNGRDILDEFGQLYKAYYWESKKEVEPIINEIMEKAQELNMLINEANKIDTQKYREISNRVSRIIPYADPRLVTNFRSFQSKFDNYFVNVESDLFKRWYRELLEYNKK